MAGTGTAGKEKTNGWAKLEVTVKTSAIKRKDGLVSVRAYTHVYVPCSRLRNGEDPTTVVDAAMVSLLEDSRLVADYKVGVVALKEADELPPNGNGGHVLSIMAKLRNGTDSDKAIETAEMLGKRMAMLVMAIEPDLDGVIVNPPRIPRRS